LICVEKREDVNGEVVWWVVWWVVWGGPLEGVFISSFCIRRGVVLWVS